MSIVTCRGKDSKALIWQHCLEGEQWYSLCLAHICPATSLGFKRMSPPSNVSWSKGPKEVIALP